MTRCVIIVEGGLVQNVVGPVSYAVLDWDGKEGGYCPWCGDEIDLLPYSRIKDIWETAKHKAPKWVKKLFKLSVVRSYSRDSYYLWCDHCKINWDTVDGTELCEAWIADEEENDPLAMYCSVCHERREDVDSDDVCPDCGGKDE